MHQAIEHFLQANTKERAATAEVVGSLIPIMDEKLYLEAGYSSLFAFLTERCRYSEASAYRRIAAAKVVKLRRESLGLLEAGKLTLCSMAEISKVITEENADALLAEVQGLSKRKTEALVAKQLPPVRPQHEKIRKVHVAPVVLPVLPPGQAWIGVKRVVKALCNVGLFCSPIRSGQIKSPAVSGERGKPLTQYEDGLCLQSTSSESNVQQG